MTFLEKLRAIERMDQLIKLKATGSAKELANKMSVSRSTVYEIIEVMKNMGAEIAYCSTRKSYYYQKEVVFAIGFVERHKVRGGKNFESIFMSPNFSDNNGLSL